jgi:hypothetical protein
LGGAHKVIDKNHLQITLLYHSKYEKSLRRLRT